MGSPYTGKVYIQLAGASYETMDGAKLSDPMGGERPDVTGTDTFGYMEKAVAPQVDAEFAHNAGLSVAQIWAFKDMTLIFRCDFGVDFILTGAWTHKIPNLTGGQGKIAVIFKAKTCDEQVNT